MAVIAGVKTGIKTIKDLKGKRVAIWPGSTQEAVILERLRMEGMTIKDIQPIRLAFSDMPAALARGDVDAYVGAEPGPGISLANGTGMLVEYPYSTPIGPLNMILSASEKDGQNESRSASRWSSTCTARRSSTRWRNPAADRRHGGRRSSASSAARSRSRCRTSSWPGSSTTCSCSAPRAYARLMHENKQIRQQPDLDKYVTQQFQ